MPLSVGFRWAQVAQEGTDVRFPTAVLYPTHAPSRDERFGPFTLGVAVDAPPLPGPHPLVVISHGSGGMPLTHRVLAHGLASRGFVVGIPEHPGNNRADNALASTAEILARRPRHVRAVADWFFGSDPFREVVRPRGYAVVGHSLGGYTALALAGGAPASLPEEEPDGHPRLIAVEPDPRVAALVLLAPATPWFRPPGSLAGVRVPILMLAGERDEHCPPGWMPGLVLEGVPDPAVVTFRVVPNAGHFSFLSPWPPPLRSPALPPSQDPPGFDRDAFMAELIDEVAGFLGSRTAPAIPGADRAGLADRGGSAKAGQR